MMLKPGTYLQDRYEILSLIGTAACQRCIRQNATL